MATVTTHDGSWAGAAIIGRMIRPEEATLSPEAARSILELRFAPADGDRASALLAGNQEGRLTDEERAELEEFLRVDAFLSVLKSKARLSLKRAGQTP